MLKNALTSGRRLWYEKFPGLGFENVRGGFGCCWLLKSCRGTGPPRFEKVLWRFVVKRRDERGVGSGSFSWLSTPGSSSLVCSAGSGSAGAGVGGD